MSNVFIKSVIAKGQNKRDSIVEFSQNLSIIYGASNTGKTYIFKIINYLFGSSKLDVKSNTGYTIFSMTISFDNKDIIFSRKLNSSRIDVVSYHHLIKSGTYSTDLESDYPINKVYLSLLGINEDFRVPFNKNCEMKRFTFRSFLHLLMINETQIERPTSIILPKETTLKTYFLSELLFILNEQDFSCYDPEEKDSIKRAKKSALKEYISNKIKDIENKINQIKQNNSILKEDIDICESINQLTCELNIIQSKIEESITNGKKILDSINSTNESLAECDILLNRYTALESQYLSDIKRLSFIVESESILSNNSTNNICPFCNNHFEEQIPPNNLESINKEIIRIKNQLNDLIAAKKDVLTEKNNSLLSIKKYNESYKKLEYITKHSLKKQENEIKSKINTLQEYIKLTSELNSMMSITASWNEDLINLDKKVAHKTIYKPIELFPSSFENELSTIIKDILKSCNLPKYETARFNLKSFDIEINNDQKNANGKGFTAFYNTVLVLALRKYLYDKANIKPFFFIIDTPLLGLDVGQAEFSNNNIRTGIYQYFINSIEQGQLIIFDNEKDMPKLNFTNKKIKTIYFSHIKDNTTRYGFLLDYED